MNDAERLVRYLRDPVALICETFALPNGQMYGDAIQPWQRSFFDAVFASNDDGSPRYRRVYDERRRGESKTEDMAAAALADLLVGSPRHRSYAVAADQEQAQLIVDSIDGFRGRSKVLHDIEVTRTLVRNPATDARLHILSSDAPTAYGLRPRRVFFDELSLQRDDRLWNAMWTAIGKSPMAQMVCVTMAGWDFTSLAWRVREESQKSPRFFFASRFGTEPAPWLSRENMDEQRETLHPADFARFWECRWTEPIGSWITREMYDAVVTGSEAYCGNDEHSYVGAVDIGLVHDATTIAVCHMEGEVAVLDALRTLRGTKAEPVQLEDVERIVRELTELFDVCEWVFEAPQAVASVQRLQQTLACVVTARYPTADTQARLFGGLYQRFATKRLRLFPHEELRREALNLVTKVVAGRLKVVDSSQIHQDHVVALGIAVDVLSERSDGPEWVFPAIALDDDYGIPITQPMVAFGPYAADPELLRMPVR